MISERSFAIENETVATVPPWELPLALERDGFLRSVISELAGTLEDVVGLEEASGYISVVGRRVGESINDSYKAALALDCLTPEHVMDVLVGLKRRIHGAFYVVEHDDTKVVFGNRACPFEEKVVGRPALCMMTSNVFGSIAADNLGYAKVVLEETIANGDAGCRIVLYLKPTPDAISATGREYFQG